ncbi:hypothetical protein LEMLEM_LOCUS22969, partial [Lemmus lemmus]
MFAFPSTGLNKEGKDKETIHRHQRHLPGTKEREEPAVYFRVVRYQLLSADIRVTLIAVPTAFSPGLEYLHSAAAWDPRLERFES